MLFPVFADVDNYNAQSLNGREIARRLDPRKFSSTLFYAREPDPRVVGLPHVRLIKMPPRLGTVRMLAESVRGYDILFKPTLNRFGYLFFHLPRFLIQNILTIQWIEEPFGDILKDAEAHVRRIFEAIYHKMDVYVAITEYVAEASARDFGLHASTIIPVGVDTRLFTPPRQRSRVPLQVLFVGHLIERKGPRFVLKAAAQFRKVQFVLVGERRGEFYKHLLETVQNEQLTNVTFFPPMPQSQLAQLMRESDILLHPSLVESVGKIVLEASATGLPAVMFSHYRSPAVVHGITGFKVKTVGEMLNCLRLLLEDHTLCEGMGEAAVEHVRRFEWDLIVKQWEDVFVQAALKKCPGS